jgi:uncharacterized protein with FMN-binding domain
MRARRALIATAAGLTLATSWPGAASAVTDPSQPVLDDYGQSGAEVTAEVNAAVEAAPAVIHARAVLAADRRLLSTRLSAESRAHAAWRYAVTHHRSKTLVRSRARTYAAARLATARARTAYAAAARTLAATLASTTAAVRAQHYTPVDGTYQGLLKPYLIPDDLHTFEPMQVQITVYGGHLSDVQVVAQAAPGTESDRLYNSRALGPLMVEAMAAHDTAAIAAVSGATLTSEAFTSSLQSALIAAGFPAA